MKKFSIVLSLICLSLFASQLNQNFIKESNNTQLANIAFGYITTSPKPTSSHTRPTSSHTRPTSSHTRPTPSYTTPSPSSCSHSYAYKQISNTKHLKYCTKAKCNYSTLVSHNLINNKCICGFSSTSNNVNQATVSIPTYNSSGNYTKTPTAIDNSTTNQCKHTTEKYGPYAGWFVDPNNDTTHYTLCSSCNSIARQEPHNTTYCNKCGYSRNTSTTLPTTPPTNQCKHITEKYGPYAGWFVDSNNDTMHYTLCASCNSIVRQETHNTTYCNKCGYSRNASIILPTTPSTNQCKHTTEKYGPYAGWFVDSNNDTMHYTLCSSCNSIVRQVPHNTTYCTTCGYSRNTSVILPTTHIHNFAFSQYKEGDNNSHKIIKKCSCGEEQEIIEDHNIKYNFANNNANLGWFVDENSHWVQCSICGKTINKDSHTIDPTKLSCTKCAYSILNNISQNSVPTSDSTNISNSISSGEHENYYIKDGCIVELDETYRNALYDLCVEYGIPEYYDLIMAQMYCESGYNPNSKNVRNDGYVDNGLMQIATINSSNYWGTGYSDLGLDVEHNPIDNIEYGVYIMSGYINKYGVQKALESYRWGEGGANNIDLTDPESCWYSTRVLNTLNNKLTKY